MKNFVNTPDKTLDTSEKITYTIEQEKPNGGRIYSFIKRLFDILTSILGMILLFVPMVIIAIIIKIDSQGPVLFKQERLGKNGTPFMIYKFRTMGTDAEKDGPRWAESNDERCTRVGRVLRNFRFDEFPQLWNIFTGDMSLVGPRPEREYFYNEYEKYIHGFKNRLAVTPGLTGLAQVNGGYDLMPEEKIIYDMEYIKKQSVLLDIKLIFKTIKLVFTHEGAR